VRIAAFLVYDILAVCAAEFLALWTRFEFSVRAIEPRFAQPALHYVPVNILVTIAIFAMLRLYSSLWEYAGVREMFNVMAACIASVLAQYIGFHLLKWGMPRSYYILDFFFLIVFIAGSRFCYRGLRTLKNAVVANRNGHVTMIIGAGDTAFSLINDINNNSWRVRNKVVCVIDSDPRKIGSKIMGIPIVGNDSKIPWAVERYGIEEIFIAIPSLAPARKKAILELCKNTGCKLRILPSVAQIVNDEVTVSNLREVEIEDLLGREQVRTNLDEVMGYISGKVILVTGGGGSIGSELC
jgi:FlaA1/EpsC-like NDP-sugar epimerase